MERLYSVSSKYHLKSCNIVFSFFFPQNKTGFGWICKGWCRHLPCWPSSTDPSTSNHRPSPHHLKIAVFECLKLMTQACGDLKFFKSRDRVVRNINRIKYKLCKGSTVSVPSTISSLVTCFFHVFSHRTRLDLDEFAKEGAVTYPADIPVRIQAQATTDLVRIISKLLYLSVWNWWRKHVVIWNFSKVAIALFETLTELSTN